jgi:hypothetical protein
MARTVHPQMQGVVLVAPRVSVEVCQVLLALQGRAELLFAPLHHASEHLASPQVTGEDSLATGESLARQNGIASLSCNETEATSGICRCTIQRQIVCIFCRCQYMPALMLYTLCMLTFMLRAACAWKKESWTSCTWRSSWRAVSNRCPHVLHSHTHASSLQQHVPVSCAAC